MDRSLGRLERVVPRPVKAQPAHGAAALPDLIGRPRRLERSVRTAATRLLE
ncbi:hypothetical protein ACYCO6_03605 [Methylobacterium sp. CM6257]